MNDFCPGAPILKDLTITPSLTLGIDHRYMWAFSLDRSAGGPTTKLAFLNYGLSFGYDLSSALKIPEKYGSLGLAAFLNFSQAFEDNYLDDEFYGGMSVSYSW
jgi:hypothetical protein